MPGIPNSKVDAVSAPELMAHIHEFARRVKLSGTPEELEAFRYLQRVMDGYGFRTRLLSHDAYISLPGTCSVEVGGERLRAITHSFSRPSPGGGLAGDLVYVGRGAAADFGKRDVRGKVVLVDGIATPDVSFHASRAGAAGQLHVSPLELLYEMCISPVWGSPSPAKVALLPTTVVATVAQSAGVALRDRLAEGERIGARLHAEVDTGWRKTPILVADLDGPVADGPFVLLSGHHDTWYYGVMDNGGANATMLEVARLCALERAEWARGLRLCFWSGHSHGRYSSSAWYADEYWEELERCCVAHVNVDSTGGIGATVLEDTASMSVLHALAADAIQAQAGQRYVGKRKGRAGDDSFGGIGVPSMFGPLSEQPPSETQGRRNLGWWWHTPEDTIDKIDPVHLVRDTRVVLHVIERLLAEPVVPLDVAAQARDLVQQVEKLQAGLGDRFALDALLAGVSSLEAMAAAVQARGAGARGDEAERISAALVLATRALVPIDYTSGDRFEHEPALPVPAWPTLQPLRDLAASEAGSESAMFAKVSATRARNRVAAAVRDATAALQGVLS